MVNLFKIITYTKYRSIHPISLDSGCDMVPKDEPDMDSSTRFQFLNKNPFLIYFIYSMTGTGEDTRTHDFESEEDFKKWQIYSLYQ
uniref:Ycf2 N-terminal domain-containing protein n=1 Tax=Helianthus annuus TaxID=4232 RepID=A0A1Y3BXP3_HELAN